MDKKKCKWYKEEMCTNDKSPCKADYCPVTKYPELCKFMEIEKKICDCYHTKIEKRYMYHPITGEAMPYGKEIGVCWGTMERDQCKCGGDRKKCDFYEKVRNG